MALISLRVRSHVKEFMVVTRADHLGIHNYIRSLLNIIVRLICINLDGTARNRVILGVCLTPHSNEPHRQLLIIIAIFKYLLTKLTFKPWSNFKYVNLSPIIAMLNL